MVKRTVKERQEQHTKAKRGSRFTLFMIIFISVIALIIVAASTYFFFFAGHIDSGVLEVVVSEEPIFRPVDTVDAASDDVTDEMSGSSSIAGMRQLFSEQVVTPPPMP